MPFNVNNIRAELNKQKSLAQPNKFRMLITGGVFSAAKAKALALLVNQAVIPGRSFATTEIRTHGPIRKAPYNSIYDDLQISIYCTNDGLFPRNIFRDWQNMIIQPVTGNVNYFDQYVADISIEQYDEEGTITYACKFIDAYPYLVAPLSLDWGATNTFHNLQVTFAYRKWLQEDIPSMPFGNTMMVNEMYPKVDLGGSLDKFGISGAAINRADGQIMQGLSGMGQLIA